MIVGPSTSCSASCGTRTAVRTGTSKGRILNTSITCLGSGESARKNCSLSGNIKCRHGKMSHNMPQNPPLVERRFRNVAVWCISCLSPGPCRLLALCAMVRGLGKGQCDRHPLVTQVRAEASLSPSAGTSRAAACIVASSHQQRGYPLGPHTTGRPPGQVVTLERNAAWWWLWWWLWCGLCI